MRNNDTIEIEPTSIPPDSLYQDQDGDGFRHRRHNHHESRPLRIRRVPMQHGWYWLIEGFMLWARNPAFLSFLTLCWLLGIIVVSRPPYVGELLGSILYPGLMLGVFNGCRAIDRKRKLSPSLLLSGFRRYAYDLLLAGFCHFIVMKTVLFGSMLIDDGMIWRASMYAEIPDMAALSSPRFLYSLLVVVILNGLWGMMYLFVPQLIGWWRLSVPKALVFSLKGCLFNWLPLFAYTFCFCFFIIVLSALVINFFELTFEGLGVVVCTVFLLIATPALIASFYVAARDIFGFPRRRKHKKRRQNPGRDEQKNQKIQT